MHLDAEDETRLGGTKVRVEPRAQPELRSNGPTVLATSFHPAGEQTFETRRCRLQERLQRSHAVEFGPHDDDSAGPKGKATARRDPEHELAALRTSGRGRVVE